MLSTKSLAAAVGCVLLAACGGAGGGPTTVSVSDALNDTSINLTSGPAASIDTGAGDTDFAGLLNGLRNDRGLTSVSYDDRLDAAAQKHAQDMVDRGYFSHTTLGSGEQVYDRIVAEGYDPRGWAENLARGQQSQGAALQGWIDSPGHNDNLNAPLEEFGLGVAGTGSQLTWVLVLGTER